MKKSNRILLEGTKLELAAYPIGDKQISDVLFIENPKHHGTNLKIYTKDLYNKIYQLTGKCSCKNNQEEWKVDTEFWREDGSSVELTIKGTITDEYRDSDLYKCVIGTGVTTIGDSAFTLLEELTEVLIPDTVTTIESYAFDGDTNLRTIVIPSSVTSIGENAFRSCYFTKDNLKNVENLDGYPWGAHVMDYTTSDGIFVKDKVLLPHPTKYEAYLVTVPSDIKVIGQDCLRYDDNLRGVYISQGVTEIRTTAFYSCKNLMFVEIPISVTNIDFGAFGNCLALLTIKYQGTKALFDAITKGEDVFTMTPMDAKLICKDEAYDLNA